MACIVDAWAVPAAKVVVGIPNAERKTKPYAVVSWSDVTTEIGMGSSKHSVVSGLECTYYGPPPAGKKGEIAKHALSKALLARISDLAWQSGQGLTTAQNFGLDTSEARHLEDMEATKLTEVILTVAFPDIEFTECS